MSFGSFDVDLASHTLRKHGLRVRLQEQPFRILTMLLERHGEVVSRDELRERLWPGNTFVEFDHSLSTAMNKLRSALCDSAETPRYIKTVPRRGYSFIAPVTTRESEPTNGVFTSTSMTATSKEPAVKEISAITGWRSLSSKFRFRPIAAGIAAVLVCVLAIIFYRQSHAAVPDRASSPVGVRRSVLVLGFNNLSQRSDVAWLSVALSDWMSTELSAGEQLRTLPAESLSRTSTQLFLRNVAGLDAQGLTNARKNLGADLVLAGSYATLKYPSGERIRLDLWLQDTRTGETISAISETGSSTDLFNLVSKSGEQLRKSLGLHDITPEESSIVAIALPANPEAARLYSEGIAKLRIFDTLAARQLLQDAVALDPNFAPVHSALAEAWNLLGYEENAKTEAAKAFDLSSNLSRSDRLLIEGRSWEMSRDWDKAIEIYHVLFEFFPDNLEYGLALARAQSSGNKWDAVLVTVATLRKLPPPLCNDPRIDLAEAEAAQSMGDLKHAEQSAARAAENARATASLPMLARARVWQARIYEGLGKFADSRQFIHEARQIYTDKHDLQGGAEAAAIEAAGLETLGDYKGALKIYQETLALHLQAGNKHATGDVYTDLGEILFALGDTAKARDSYLNAMSIYREIDDDDGKVWAEIGLGQLMRNLGKHAEAKRLLKDAVAISRQIGARNATANAICELGIVLHKEGDIEAAKQSLREGLEVFQDIGDKTDAAEYKVEFAQILLDEGNFAEAITLARAAADEFGREKNRDGALANATLSRALLRQGNIEGARQALNDSIAILKGVPDPEAQFAVGITSDSIRAASGGTLEAQRARSDLQEIIRSAQKIGFVSDELDARFALGEIEIKAGNKARARMVLEDLERDARNSDFGLLAHKATASLEHID